MKAEIYYFTGTGNSLYVAQEINKVLLHRGELLSIAHYQNDETVQSDAEVIGFVFPIYMGSVPWIVAEFIKKLKIEKSPYVFAIATYNSHVMQCLQVLSEVLRSNSISLSLAETVNMPGNAKASSQKENENRLNASAQRIVDIAQKINDRVTASQIVSSRITKKVAKVYEHTSIAKLKVLPSCNGCGICTKVCPTRNIVLKDKKPTWGKNCSSCLACFHWCPQNAIKWTVPIVGNSSQYHHPEVKVTEIIKQQPAMIETDTK
jgi:ferredoxin